MTPAVSRALFGTVAAFALVTACGSRTLPGSGAPGPRDAGVDVTPDAPDAGDVFYACEAGGAPSCDAGVAYFDRFAAACALALVPVSACRQPEGPTGSGHVKVTFAPSGDVVLVDVDQPPFEGTPTATCLVALFRKVKTPPFCGENITVGKSFSIP